MADNLWGSILEVFIGLAVIPRMITFAWIFITTYFSLNATVALIIYIVISIVIALICLHLRKVLGIGFVIGFFIDLVLGYMGLFGDAFGPAWNFN